MILAIDSDVPWIPAVNHSAADNAIYCVDLNPLKPQMNVWYVPACHFAMAPMIAGRRASASEQAAPRWSACESSASDVAGSTAMIALPEHTLARRAINAVS